MDFQNLEHFMAQWDIPFEVIRTNIAEIVFEERKESNPCALCAKMRKGAFNDRVKADGCNKVALGIIKKMLSKPSCLVCYMKDGSIHFRL